jgi:hypothetical protein
MADGRAVHDPDRLPWLSDTRRPRRSSDSTSLLFWAFLAIVLVAGVSYWLGIKSVRQPDEFTDILGGPPAVTEELPQPTPSPARPMPPPAPAPVEAPGLPDASPVFEPAPVPIPGVARARPEEVEAAADRAPKIAPQKSAPSKKAAVAAEADSGTAEAPKDSDASAAPRPKRLQAWPADQSAGAYGRVVRVGTFYSRRQAKQGWARIVRVYPGMRRLRAVVVGNPSLRNGRTFYRLQFGTTSQAHSEVLCQRMRVVGQSCVTVGLPGRGA